MRTFRKRHRGYRVSRFSAVHAVAAILWVASAGFLLAWWLWVNPTDRWRDWLPNAGTSAAFAALTITVIDWAIRRRERERLLPLIGPMLDHLTAEFSMFIAGVAEDYATTHSVTLKPMPENPFDLLDFWIAEQDAADLPHAEINFDRGTLRDMGFEFAYQVDYHEKQLRDLIEPTLRAAMQSLARTPNRVRDVLENTHAEGFPPELAKALDPERASYRMFVQEAHDLGRALHDVRPSPTTRRVDRDTIDAALDARDYRLRKLSSDAAT